MLQTPWGYQQKSVACRVSTCTSVLKLLRFEAAGLLQGVGADQDSVRAAAKLAI